MKSNSNLHVVDRFSISLQVEEDNGDCRPCLAQYHHLYSKVAAPFQRGEGGHIEAHGGQAAGARLWRQEGSYDTGCRCCQMVAMFGSWQPSSDAVVFSKLVVAHFCMSDLSVELQSQGKPVAEVQCR